MMRAQSEAARDWGLRFPAENIEVILVGEEQRAPGIIHSFDPGVFLGVDPEVRLSRLRVGVLIQQTSRFESIDSLVGFILPDVRGDLMFHVCDWHVFLLQRRRCNVGNHFLRPVERDSRGFLAEDLA